MAAPDHCRLCPLGSGWQRKSRRILTLGRVASWACLASSCPLARPSPLGREKEQTGLVMKIAVQPIYSTDGVPENRVRSKPYFTNQRAKTRISSDFGSAIRTCKRHVVLNSPLSLALSLQGRGDWVQTGIILYILDRVHGLRLAGVSGEGGFAEALQRDVHHGHRPDTSLTCSPTILHPSCS